MGPAGPKSGHLFHAGSPSFRRLKAGFYWRRSRSRGRNQKRKAIRSSENQTDGVGSRTMILLMTPSLTIK